MIRYNIKVEDKNRQRLNKEVQKAQRYSRTAADGWFRQRAANTSQEMP